MKGNWKDSPKRENKQIQAPIKSLERFAKKFSIQDNGCWVWNAYCIKGYGQFRSGGYQYSAHRWLYSVVNNIVIPLDMHCDHICRNPPCVNPQHIRIVTPGENVLAGYGPAAIAARKTHCMNGHPFSKENTRLVKTNSRVCKTCNSKWQRDNRQKKKGIIK